MPQVNLANTQCTLLATLCESAAHLPTCDASHHTELIGIAEVLRKAN